MPEVAWARVADVMLREAGAMVMDSVAEAVWAGELLSVTVAVKFAVPAVVPALPLIRPLDGTRASPAGRLPEVIVH